MSVTVCDVGPRDGLQNQPVTLAPGVRAELVDRLAAAGVPRIEAVSFVSPKAVPQMAGAEEVVAAIERREGVVYAGLALNEKGYDRLRETGLDEVHFAFAATEEFNQRNQRASVDESVAAAERILARATRGRHPRDRHDRRRVRLPLRGRRRPGPRGRARRAARGRRTRSCVADTIGVGVPRQVRDLVGRVAPLGIPVGDPPPQHAQHRVRERARRARGGRDGVRRLGRRDRRLPVRAPGDGEHRDRGPRRTSSTARASRRASTSTR